MSVWSSLSSSPVLPRSLAVTARGLRLAVFLLECLWLRTWLPSAHGSAGPTTGASSGLQLLPCVKQVAACMRALLSIGVSVCLLLWLLPIALGRPSYRQGWSSAPSSMASFPRRSTHALCPACCTPTLPLVQLPRLRLMSSLALGFSHSMALGRFGQLNTW